MADNPKPNVVLITVGGTLLAGVCLAISKISQNTELAVNIFFLLVIIAFGLLAIYSSRILAKKALASKTLTEHKPDSDTKSEQGDAL